MERKQKLLDYFFSQASEQMPKAMRIARNGFAKLCMQNARLIGSPLPVNLLVCKDDDLEELLKSKTNTIPSSGSVIFEIHTIDDLKALCQMMSRYGFLIYDWMDAPSINRKFLAAYNFFYDAKLCVADSTHFGLAVKKEHLDYSRCTKESTVL